MKAVQITPNSYFLQIADKTEALIHQHESGFRLLGPEINVDYNTWQDIEKEFGKLKVTQKKKSNNQQGPDGYPIRHEEFHNVDHDDNKNPMYTVTAHSHVRYYAGYWCLKFNKSNKYQVVLCPKRATIKEHEALGPYKHRIECLNEVNILNSRTDNNEQTKE